MLFGLKCAFRTNHTTLSFTLFSEGRGVEMCTLSNILQGSVCTVQAGPHVHGKSLKLVKQFKMNLHN